ncbi:D-serine deaminase-like pyridoxal phosphate-dependent protein [Isoptericola jiangsuensis]|uniref:D-serine deaminase-like pyridoxal phosphate-dependent protein n=1 Tax=Isoptericola jiangsuensis TaxID=548579 RepID=A0A2A9EZA8_9MICO|nr:alanine racemase [Isoptericola jiangsuensis]PFG44374.1 D-serine deaminase-like pyridoxal phosphate-dependent protein [Isoptericola jiangsuensis]
MTTNRLTRATAGVPGPVAVVDLDAFDANAADLLRRAAGTPVRLAAKSVRVRSLVERGLDAGFRGVMAFTLAEALWLVEQGVADVLVGYPTVDRDALARLAADPRARREITLMADDAAHVALLRTALAAAAPGPDVAVCLDVDASLRVGRAHLGTRRSPLRTPAQVAHLAALADRDGVHVRGLMTYEAQVAGIPDTPVNRVVKAFSVPDVDRRRRAVLDALHATLGRDVELVNAGGTGSLETSAAGPGVTEVTAGSGLFVPGTFDRFRSFVPRPAAYFGLDVVRTPAPDWATAFGGGYVASGPAGTSRLPRLVTPGWSLTRREAAGEVQTPLHRRRDGRPLDIGDRVWFRHAKAGELMERFAVVHLVRGDEVVDVVPTYRGEGHTFG